MIYAKHPDGYEAWYEHDENGNVIHRRDSTGRERWYDSNGNVIHSKFSNGYEAWAEYDANGNLIHERNSYGSEYWYDSNGNRIPKSNMFKTMVPIHEQ